MFVFFFSESNSSDSDAGAAGWLLQLVQEVVQCGDALLQPFAFAGLGHHLGGTAGAVEGIPGQDLPVVEHALGEGLATGVGPQVSCKTWRGEQRCRDERWFPAASRHHLSHRADVVHVVSNSTNLSHSSATVTFHFPLIPFRNAAGDPQQDPKGAPKPPRGHPSLQGWQLAGHLAAYIPSSWSGAAGHQGSPTRAGFRIYLPVAVSSCAPLATLPEPPHSPKDSLTGR